MKKFLVGALMLCGAASMAFAGGHAKKTFALVPKAMNNPFFDLARDGCKRLKVKSPESSVCTLVLGSIRSKSKFRSYRI